MEGPINSIELESKQEKTVSFANKDLFRRICDVSDRGVGRLEALLGVRLIPRGHRFLIQSDSVDRVQFALHFFKSLTAQYLPGMDRLPDDFDLRYLFRQIQSATIADKNNSSNPNCSIHKQQNLPEKIREPMKDTLEKQTEPHAGEERHDLNVNAGPSLDFESDSKNSKLEKDFQHDVIITTARGKKVYPRTVRQARFTQSIQNNEITICMGPAGTGKTFLSIAMACRLLKKGAVERLVLTRPAVEAGESLGYLPGDLTQKVDPYLRPLYDALYECLGYDRVGDLISTRKIEVAPLAFMRGRTLNDSFVILDEAQNCTRAQLKMFLTRLGRGSRMCLGGDITQIDLSPGKSGLLQTSKLLTHVAGVGVVRFESEDIIRNPLVERIVQAFEKLETN